MQSSLTIVFLKRGGTDVYKIILMLPQIFASVEIATVPLNSMKSCNVAQLSPAVLLQKRSKYLQILSVTEKVTFS